MATLLLTLRAALKEAGDPLRAPKMQAYMKSAMPFHGVPAPARRSLTRKLFAGRSWPDADAFAAEVRALWKGATFREERYAAVQLTGHRAAKALQGPALLPLYEELIVSGAWWDYVDELAAHRVGPLLLAHPGEVRPAMLSWSRSSDLWKRRTAILCQLRFKAKTDLPLLHAAIEPALGEKEFFLRKAIGWALREYAKTDPQEVRRYVALHRPRMSGLSVREALKHLGEA